jgi:hypothetical protein
MTTLEILHDDQTLSHANWMIQITDIGYIRVLTATASGSLPQRICIVLRSTGHSMECDYTDDDWATARRAYGLAVANASK